ncbi:unnamed protein product [Rotaria magnacalcarata]
MKRKHQNVPNKIEEINTYRRLCNNHRQEERRKRLANVFASNDIILADPSVMFVEDVSVFAEEENVDDDTLEDSSEQCNQDIIPPDYDRQNDDFETCHIEYGNVDRDDEFEDFNNDDNLETTSTFDSIIAPILELVDDEAQIQLLVAEYICQANLDKLKTNKLLTLLTKLHDQHMAPPLSMNSLWKKLGVKFNYLTIRYCSNCGSELIESMCHCKSVNKLISSELIIFPIGQEITRVITNNYHMILQNKLTKFDNDNDVVRGEIYKQQSGRSPHPITLLLSSDGKPTIKSSKCSFWPVLASIIEVPRPFRDYEQNLMLFCLWHSPRSPTADQLLGRVSKDLADLVKSGIDIEIHDLGWIHFDIFIQGVCADGPGQSKITQMVSHNGYFGCRICELEGRYRSIDRTCTYPWSSFEHTCPSFRIKDRFERCLKEADRLKIIGNKNINVYGIKGVSPLNQLIFIPTQAIYDYFHLCLEGHMKVLLKEWNDVHYGSSVQSRPIIENFDSFFSSINYPHSIHRRIGNFRLFNDWKAAQLRLFLIYLGLPFLLFFCNNFPPILVYHFSLYSIYIRTLCHFNERNHIYDVRPFIEAHLSRFPEFYKNAKELLSTHCNVHLWQQVIRHGSLSATSMFGSESYLHGLYKLAHGTKQIGEQIGYWYTIHRAIHSWSIRKQPATIHHGHFMDGYINESVITKYKQQFQHSFLSLRSKCFFLPFHDDRFIVCTPIDNEILEYCSSFSIYFISLYLRKMYMTPTNRRKESQSIVRTSNSSSQQPQVSQHQHSTQHQHTTQHQHSTQHERLVIRQPSSQVANLFGPIRSSPTRSRPQKFPASHNQHSTSPYNINSPRTNRRHGTTSYRVIDAEVDDCEDENTQPSRPVTVDRNTLDKLVGHCSMLENEVRTLQSKTDKLLKIALVSVKNQQEPKTTKPKAKLNPVLWNDQNLLAKPRTPSATTYLCHLVGKIYTSDEIKNKIPQLPPQDNDNAFVQLYFSHDPPLFVEFMDTKGKESLYGQECTKKMPKQH